MDDSAIDDQLSSNSKHSPLRLTLPKNTRFSDCIFKRIANAQLSAVLPLSISRILFGVTDPGRRIPRGYHTACSWCEGRSIRTPLSPALQFICHMLMVAASPLRWSRSSRVDTFPLLVPLQLLRRSSLLLLVERFIRFSRPGARSSLRPPPEKNIRFDLFFQHKSHQTNTLTCSLLAESLTR